MTPLTAKQKMMFIYIVGYIKKHLSIPSMRHLAAAHGITSTNAINDYLKALNRKGYILFNEHNTKNPYTITEAARAKYGLVFGDDKALQVKYYNLAYKINKYFQQPTMAQKTIIEQIIREVL